VTGEEEEFEEVSLGKEWEKFRWKLWKKGFDIALVGAGIEIANKFLPEGCRLVYHDGLWWLRFEGRRGRRK